MAWRSENGLCLSVAGDPARSEAGTLSIDPVERPNYRCGRAHQLVRGYYLKRVEIVSYVLSSDLSGRHRLWEREIHRERNRGVGKQTTEASRDFGGRVAVGCGAGTLQSQMAPIVSPISRRPKLLRSALRDVSRGKSEFGGHNGVDDERIADNNGRWDELCQETRQAEQCPVSHAC